MAGVITTGNHPKALWPGIHAWWGINYNEYPTEYTEIFDVLGSQKAYEEEVGTTGFFGDGFHHIVYGAEIVTCGSVEIDQRFERVDEQRINRFRLFAFCPLLLARVFIQKLPPAGIDELLERIALLEQALAQSAEREKRLGAPVSDEEWLPMVRIWKFSDGWACGFERRDVDALIASRLAAPAPKEGSDGNR